MNNKKWYYFWGIYTTVFCLYLLIIIGYMVMESIRIFQSKPSLERLLAAGYIFYGVPILSAFLFSFMLSAINYFKCRDRAWVYIFLSSLVYIIFSFPKHTFAYFLDSILNLGGGLEGIFLYLDTIYLLPLVIIGCYKIFKFAKNYKVKE